MSSMFGVGASGTVSSASGGKVYGYNAITTVPANVVPTNPARKKIIFHNPGTITLYIAPAFTQNTGSNVALTPSTAALGGCFALYSGAWLEITGECQGAWQAFAASGTTNSLTVMDSNI